MDVVGGILGILGLGGPVYALIESQELWMGQPGHLPAARPRHPQLHRVPVVGVGVRHPMTAARDLHEPQLLGGQRLDRVHLRSALARRAHRHRVPAAGRELPATLARARRSCRCRSRTCCSPGCSAGSPARYGPRFFMTAGPIIGGIGYLLMLRMGEQRQLLDGRAAGSAAVRARPQHDRRAAHLGDPRSRAGGAGRASARRSTTPSRGSPG